MYTAPRVTAVRPCTPRLCGVGRGRRPRRPGPRGRIVLRRRPCAGGGRPRTSAPTMYTALRATWCARPCTPRLCGVGRDRRPRRPARTYRPPASIRSCVAVVGALYRHLVCATLKHMDDLPVRKRLNHHAPYCLPGTFFFVTICARARGVTDFVENAAMILEAVRRYHVTGKWFVTLCLVMPDHLHMLVHVPIETVEQPGVVGGGGPRPFMGVCGLPKTIGEFKSFLSKTGHLCFQRGFFDTRIRDEAHYAEKWAYIVRNPVARGLSATPREWPHAIAFSRQTGEEIPHR